MLIPRSGGFTVELLEPTEPRFVDHGGAALALALTELLLLAHDIVPRAQLVSALRRLPPATLAELRELPPAELGRMLVAVLALVAPVIPLRSLARWVVNEGVQMLCAVYPPGVEPAP